MEYIQLLAGPAVGAVIGYCTNYIAVKMMFRPLEPVVFMGKRLPLTPGVIPKNKGRIARALGRAVSESLLTEKDLTAAFLRTEIKEKVEDLILEKLETEAFQETTLDNLLETWAGQEKTRQTKAKVDNFLVEKISGALARFDVEEMLSTAGVKAIMGKIQNSMLAMFINESTVRSLIGPIGASIRNYLEHEGKEQIEAVAKEEMNKIYSTELGRIIDLESEKETIRGVISGIYEKTIEKLIPPMTAQINIAQIVEKKINAMEIGFLEEMLLSIIKTELDYVVRLGALIGFVIGCVNIFI